MLTNNDKVWEIKSTSSTEKVISFCEVFLNLSRLGKTKSKKLRKWGRTEKKNKRREYMAKQNKRSEKKYIVRTEEKKNKNKSKLKQVLWLKLSYLPGLTLGLWLVELLLP